jgi:hypothetical protein
MSIDQKIAELLDEAKKLQEQEAVELDEAVSTKPKISGLVNHLKNEHGIGSGPDDRQDLSRHVMQNKPPSEEKSRDFLNRHFRLKKRIDTPSEESHKKFHELSVTAHNEYRAAKKLQEQEEVTEISSEEEQVVEEQLVAEEEMKIDVSEDVAALVNGEELTEEFKTKAATIFEAAVVSRVKSELTKLEEQFDMRLQEEVEQIKEGLVEKVDGYLNYVVEQWMNDNELALENGMKNEILESFVGGLKGLFEQHYIDIPEEKYDVLGDLQEQVETAESMLSEQLEVNVALTKEINEMRRQAATAEFAAGMVDTDAEKFAALAEELAFEDVDSFKQKLQTIKENYFGKKQQPVVAEAVSSVVTDEVPTQLTEEVAIDPTMARYLRAFNGVK